MTTRPATVGRPEGRTGPPPGFWLPHGEDHSVICQGQEERGCGVEDLGRQEPREGLLRWRRFL